MAGAGEGGPVRLAILVGSIAALSLIGMHTLTEGASASHRRAGGTGKVVALAVRRSLPASVRRQLAQRSPLRPRKLRVPVTGAAKVADGDRIFVLGGTRADGRPTSLIQDYDLRRHRSAVAGRLPGPVTDGAALTLDGFVFLAGGLVDGTPTRAIVRVDPRRGRAVLAGHLPVPATGGFGLASRQRRGYLVGATVPGPARLNLELTLRTRGH
jgi:hypothetical protein